jgi:hypothetical protein
MPRENRLLRLEPGAKYRTRRLRAEKDDARWLHRLPVVWRTQVEPPWEFHQYHDEELGAVRVVGSDIDGQPCYTTWRFSLIEPRSDDDETFYSVEAYGEELAAWRLHDERWLIWREIRTEETPESGHSFYSFSATMPR